MQYAQNIPAEPFDIGPDFEIFDADIANNAIPHGIVKIADDAFNFFRSPQHIIRPMYKLLGDMRCRVRKMLMPWRIETFEIVPVAADRTYICQVHEIKAGMLCRKFFHGRDIFLQELRFVIGLRIGFEPV